MNIDGSLCPYLSNFILTTIASKLCFGNIDLRYGIKNLSTGNKFKGLASLVLAYHAADQNLSHQFATFNQLKKSFLSVEKGAKTFHAPIIQKNTNIKANDFTTKLDAACFFNADQVVGFKSELKPEFNISAFNERFNLVTSDHQEYMIKLVHLLESFCENIGKHNFLVYNLLAAYFSDILDVKVPQKNAQHFVGTLTLTDLRTISIVANKIIDNQTADLQRPICSKDEALSHLNNLRALIKSNSTLSH